MAFKGAWGVFMENQYRVGSGEIAYKEGQACTVF